MSLRSQQHQCKYYHNSITSSGCNGKQNCLKHSPPRPGFVAVGGTTAAARKSNGKQIKTNQTNFVRVKRRNQIRSIDGGTESRMGSVNEGGRNSSISTSGSLVFNNRRGCGHSHPNPINFSRRNSSSTTVTFSSPCASPAEVYNSRTGMPKKVASGTSIRVAMSPESSLRHEYTAQRRYYETAKQLMALVAAQQNTMTQEGECAGVMISIDDAAGGGTDVARLRALQQFRLENVNDCFNIHRQQDLHIQPREMTSSWTEKLQQAHAALQKTKQQESVIKKTEISDKPTQVKVEKDERLMPYAVRQKLLQLRLEGEDIGRLKPGRKLYGAIGTSCALRYQETY